MCKKDTSVAVRGKHANPRHGKTYSITPRRRGARARSLGATNGRENAEFKTRLVARDLLEVATSLRSLRLKRTRAAILSSTTTSFAYS